MRSVLIKSAKLTTLFTLLAVLSFVSKFGTLDLRLSQAVPSWVAMQLMFLYLRWKLLG
jgi:hypothetical protein